MKGGFKDDDEALKEIDRVTVKIFNAENFNFEGVSIRRVLSIYSDKLERISQQYITDSVKKIYEYHISLDDIVTVDEALWLGFDPTFHILYILSKINRDMPKILNLDFTLKELEDGYFIIESKYLFNKKRLLYDYLIPSVKTERIGKTLQKINNKPRLLFLLTYPSFEFSIQKYIPLSYKHKIYFQKLLCFIWYKNDIKDIFEVCESKYELDINISNILINLISNEIRFHFQIY